VVVFVDGCSDDAFSADGPQAGHVPGGLGFDVRWTLPPGLVRSAAVAVGQVLTEHWVQVAFAGDQDPVWQLAAQGPVTRPQMAFIRGVFGMVVMIRGSSDVSASPDAVVNSGSRS
jgi:hypothetical protein